MTQSSKTCDLCGLPLPSRTFSKTQHGQPYTFCCIGCKQVFIMISEVESHHDLNAYKETELFQKCMDLGIIPRSEDELTRVQAEYFREKEKGKANVEDLQKANSEKVLLSLHLNIFDMWCRPVHGSLR